MADPPAPPVPHRNPERVPFLTGQRVLDMLAPIAKGSSATVIGGFGEGKTMLLEQLAKWGDADVIIYVGCGERGNELADLIDELTQLTDPRTGRRLMERTIILANTSNMPVMAREASIYTAVTVAEFYRDMGYHAVIIADSTSRWAEAQRELASRTGAIPAEEGYPADLPASLAAFYQRAGRVTTLGRPRWHGHHRHLGLATRRRRHRTGLGPHPTLRPGGLVARPRPRLRPPLPGGQLAQLVLA